MLMLYIHLVYRISKKKNIAAGIIFFFHTGLLSFNSIMLTKFIGIFSSNNLKYTLYTCDISMRIYSRIYGAY